MTRVRTKERQIEKTTRTDGDRGDEAHASFYSLGLYMCICSDMTAEPIDPGAYAAAPLATHPPSGRAYADCVDVPIRPARVIANCVDVSICLKVELS